MNTVLDITFIPTLNCNLDCSYCYWKKEKDKRKQIERHNFIKIIQFIKQYEADEINFQIYGGEPTIWDHLPFYLYTLSYQGNINVSINTNLMRSKKYFEAWSIYKKLHVIATLHPSKVDNVNEWFKKVEVLNNVEVVIMEDGSGEGKKIADSIIKYNYRQHVIVTLRYVEEFRPVNYGSHKKKICRPGFIIRENGDVMRCWSEMEFPNYNLFNLYKDKMKKLTLWKYCIHEICFCVKDIPRLTKEEYEREVLCQNIAT